MGGFELVLLAEQAEELHVVQQLPELGVELHLLLQVGELLLQVAQFRIALDHRVGPAQQVERPAVVADEHGVAGQLEAPFTLQPGLVNILLVDRREPGLFLLLPGGPNSQDGEARRLP